MKRRINLSLRPRSGDLSAHIAHCPSGGICAKMSAYVQESLFSVRLGGRPAACGAAFLRASRGPVGFCQPAGEAGTPCRGPEGVRGDPGGQDTAARQ